MFNLQPGGYLGPFLSLAALPIFVNKYYFFGAEFEPLVLFPPSCCPGFGHISAFLLGISGKWKLFPAAENPIVG